MLSMDIKRGIKNISYSVIGQIITLIIGIFIPRLVIVSYGSEVNGLLSSTTTIISYLALLEAGVGAATCQALYRPIHDQDRKSINEILSATHYYYRRTGIAYFVLVSLISLLYPLVISSTLNYWFMSIIIFINGLPGVINYFFQRKYISFLEALGENYIIINLQTIITVVASIMKIILLQLNVSIIIVQIIYAITSLVQMIFILAYIKKKYGWISVREKPNYKALKQKNAALVHQVCSLVTNSTDVIVLSTFCNLETVSIYTVYNMIFAIVYNAVLSVNSGVQYALGQAFCNGKDYYVKIADAYETYYVTIASSLLLVTYIMITPFLYLYTAGADINYIDPYFPLMFLIVKLLNSFRNSSINTITVSGFFGETQKHAVIESVLNLSISIFSVWKFGMVGVLFGTAVAFLYRCIVAIRFANKKILDRSCQHSFRVMFLNSLLIFIGVIFSRYISFQCENYLAFFGKASLLAFTTLMLFGLINSIFDINSFRLTKRIAFSKIMKKR